MGILNEKRCKNDTDTVDAPRLVDRYTFDRRSFQQSFATSNKGRILPNRILERYGNPETYMIIWLLNEHARYCDRIRKNGIVYNPSRFVTTGSRPPT